MLAVSEPGLEFFAEIPVAIALAVVALFAAVGAALAPSASSSWP